jgi:hypothetical protein
MCFYKQKTKQHYDIGLSKLLELFQLAHIWIYGLTLQNDNQLQE